MLYTRRDFGRMTLAGLPLSLALAGIDSRIKGVLIGVQTYSFRSLPDPGAIIDAMVKIGLGAAEVMSNHVEALAGAPSAGRGGGPGPGRGPAPAPPTPPTPPSPPAAGAGQPPMPPAPPEAGQARGRGRGQMTPEQTAAMQARLEELRKWRASVSMDKFKEVRQKFDAAGVEPRLLCYNWNRNTTDDEIEYAFLMAHALGVKGITTSTQLSVAKRVAPFADKHRMLVGYHNHDNVKDPEEFATPESFASAIAMSKFHAINLDIGHFAAAGYDPVPYIQQHHARMTNLHLKDRKRNVGETRGANVPWGQGDTPIKPVLQLLRDRKYDIPANIEFEYPGDPVEEVARCYQYCKDALA